MKKSKIIILTLLVLLLTSGCTKYLSDDENKKVVYETTGQTLPSNILCQPEEKELLEMYTKYESKMPVKLKNIPKCSNFKIYDKKNTAGIWETIFVRPLAFVILKLGNLITKYGLAVMLMGLIIRLLLFPLSRNSIKQTENMKKAQPELAKLEKKYSDKNDKDSMMKKSEEMMVIYKKYKINPITGCLVAFIQLPLFLAFLEAINRVPAIFEETLFTLQLGTTPLVGLKNGNYMFILLIILLVSTTYFSLKNTMQQTAAGDNTQKQTQLMSKIMLVVISIASLTLPAAITLYWITTNTFTIVQNYLVQKRGK